MTTFRVEGSRLPVTTRGYNRTKLLCKICLPKPPKAVVGSSRSSGPLWQGPPCGSPHAGAVIQSRHAGVYRGPHARALGREPSCRGPDAEPSCRSIRGALMQGPSGGSPHTGVLTRAFMQEHRTGPHARACVQEPSCRSQALVWPLSCRSPHAGPSC